MIMRVIDMLSRLLVFYLKKNKHFFASSKNNLKNVFEYESQILVMIAKFHQQQYKAAHSSTLLLILKFYNTYNFSIKQLPKRYKNFPDMKMQRNDESISEYAFFKLTFSTKRDPV